MIYDWSDSFLRFHESCLASKKGLLYFPTYLRLFQKNERERYYVLLLSLSLSWSFVFLFKNAFKHYYSRMNLLLDDRTAPRVQFHKKTILKAGRSKAIRLSIDTSFFHFPRTWMELWNWEIFSPPPSQSVNNYLFILSIVSISWPLYKGEAVPMCKSWILYSQNSPVQRDLWMPG